MFNSREIATFIWLYIFICFAFREKKLRKSTTDTLSSMLKILLQFKMLTLIIPLIAYIFAIIYIMSMFSVWSIEYLKITVYWFFGTVVVVFVNAYKAYETDDYIRRIIFDNVKLIVVVEYFLNIYTFSLFWELITVPIIFFVVISKVITDKDEKYKDVTIIFNTILSAYFILLLTATVISAAKDIRLFTTQENVYNLLIPLILTLLYLPFVYLIAFIMAFERVTIPLNIYAENDVSLRRYAKKKLFIMCRFSMKRLKLFASEFASDFWRIKDSQKVDKIISDFARMLKNRSENNLLN